MLGSAPHRARTHLLRPPHAIIAFVFSDYLCPELLLEEYSVRLVLLAHPELLHPHRHHQGSSQAHIVASVFRWQLPTQERCTKVVPLLRAQ